MAMDHVEPSPDSGAQGNDSDLLDADARTKTALEAGVCKAKPAS